MDPTIEKVFILIGMFIATLLFSMIPFKLVGVDNLSTKWKKSVSLCSCFSGGVFLAACLLDLFPEIHKAINRVQDEIEKKYNTKIDYPVAEFVICCGFFVVLILEQGILAYKEYLQRQVPILTMR